MIQTQWNFEFSVSSDVIDCAFGDDNFYCCFRLVFPDEWVIWFPLASTCTFLGREPVKISGTEFLCGLDVFPSIQSTAASTKEIARIKLNQWPGLVLSSGCACCVMLTLLCRWFADVSTEPHTNKELDKAGPEHQKDRKRSVESQRRCTGVWRWQDYCHQVDAESTKCHVWVLQNGAEKNEPVAAVSQISCHDALACNFTECWPIFRILVPWN